MAQRALDVLPSGARQSCEDKGYVVTVTGCEEERLVHLLRMHKRMSCVWHRLTKMCWQRLAGHCVALLLLCQCRRSLEQKCASQNPAATRSAWSPAKQVVLVCQQAFRQDLSLLRVVPCPFPCHKPTESSSPSVFGVLVQDSTDRVLLPPIWRHRWRNQCYCCVFARTVKKVGQLRGHASVEDLTSANHW